MKRIIPLLTVVVLLAAACSDSERFRVNGTIEGKPSMNIRAEYYTRGAYQTLVTAVREGEFEFYGTADQPTMLEITDNEHRPIARLWVVNGETYQVDIDPSTPFGIATSGSDINARWSAFLREHGTEGNSAVADYISGHPDDIVSTLLLISHYDASADPAGADSLMSLIAPAARPSAITDGFNYLLHRLISEEAETTVDSIVYFDTHIERKALRPSEHRRTLIAFSTADGTLRRDSVAPMLRRAARPAKDTAIVDVSLDADTATWLSGHRADSIAAISAWAPGGVASVTASRLAISDVPFFVVCDSAGRQLYRGPSASEAEKIFKE